MHPFVMPRGEGTAVSLTPIQWSDLSRDQLEGFARALLAIVHEGASPEHDAVFEAVRRSIREAWNSMPDCPGDMTPKESDVLARAALKTIREYLSWGGAEPTHGSSQAPTERNND